MERIAETPESRNSRRGYDEGKLNELAASIREHGILQPILVTPDGDGYRVIAGNRRLRRQVRAGLETIPALIKTQVDAHREFFMNLVENVQRVDLTGKERIEAIQLLAASGLGVREISRGTGISPGTISRWLRIADRPMLARALEEERLDIARAMTLAPDPRREALARLLDTAAATPRADLNAAVQSCFAAKHLLPGRWPVGGRGPQAGAGPDGHGRGRGAPAAHPGARHPAARPRSTPPRPPARNSRPSPESEFGIDGWYDVGEAAGGRSMAVTPHRVTLEEFLRMPEERPPLELHGGLVYQDVAERSARNLAFELGLSLVIR